MHEESYKNPSRVCVKGGLRYNMIMITINTMLLLLLYLLIFISSVQNFDLLKCSILSSKFILYLYGRSPQSMTPVITRRLLQEILYRNTAHLLHPFELLPSLVLIPWLPPPWERGFYKGAIILCHPR